MKSLQNIILLVLLISINLYADVKKKSYVGLAIGSSSFDDGGYYSDLAKYAKRVSPSTVVEKNYTSTGYKLYFGGKINKIFSIESSLTEYGESSISITPGVGSTMSPSATAIALNIGYDFEGKDIRLFSLLGPSLVNFNDTTHTDAFILALRYGLGVEYTPSYGYGLGFRVAYEGDYCESNVDAHKPEMKSSYAQNISMAYFGVSYKF